MDRIPIDRTFREARKERAWRMLRLTSSIATAVLVIVLIAIDATFRFASWRLNVTIALVSLFLIGLLKLDTLLHRLLRRYTRQHD